MRISDLVGAEAADILRGARILLVGATGRNGSAVLEIFDQLGIELRCMSRNAQRAGRALDHGRHQWIRGDVTDPGTLTAAMHGIDIVISAAATAMPVGRNRPEKVDFEGTVNLIRAARVAGVKRFVIITSSVSGRQGGVMNFIGRNVLVWKGRAEEALIESGLDYAIVGPARMNDEPGGQKRIKLIPRADYRAGMTVTRQDLAAVVVAVAAIPAAARRTFSVVNTDEPADLAWQAACGEMPAK